MTNISPNKSEARRKRPRVSDDLVYQTILKMCDAVGTDSSVRPQDIAMALATENWQMLLKRIRLFSVKLAQDGHIFIMRKGKPADPDDFKGVYRLQIAPDFDRSLLEED